MSFFHSLLYSAGEVLPGYDYRRGITVVNTGNPNVLEEDQISISLTSSNFNFANAMSNGEDIRFTKADGTTLLNHWIESYNAAGQTATIWVKVSDISAFSSGTIYMYYGAPGSTTASSWTNTMQRFEQSRSGGTTNYLIRFDEGTGTTVANTGTTGGNLTISGTAPTWNSTNVYGFTGARPVFNGTNNVISIPGLLDTYPTNFEISFSVIFDVITGGPRVFNKQNRRDDGVGNDYGDSFFFYCHPTGNLLTLSTRNGTGAATLIQTSYAAVVGTLYKVSIVKKGDIIGMYINGLLVGRSRWYAQNGSSDAFKIGAESNYSTGANELFFAGKINDFRYTDYTSGDEPRLPQIEAEHSLTRFVQKNKRTKFAKTRKLITTNYPTGTVANYRAEPFGMYDDSKYKLWFSHGDGVLRYRESLTSDGLASAADQLIYGAGTGGEAGNVHLHSLIKEGSTLYMYYAIGFTGPIYVVQSSDGGITWTNKQTALAKPASGFGSPGLVNTAVVKVGSTFYMLVEAYTGASAPTWQIGVATSSSVTGPFTMSGANPRTALQRSTNGSYGGPSMLHDGSMYHVIHHANGNGDASTNDQIYYASSTDLVTFTADANPVGKIADELLAYDQFADATISTDGTSVFLDYAGMDNRTPFFGSILRATFAGTLSQLVTDLSVTVNTQQTL